MRFRTLALLLLAPLALCAQLQSADAEGQAQIGPIKKLNKKAKYGAYLITKNISFAPATGIDKEPTVTAEEEGKVEMVAVEKGADLGYLLPYNSFIKLKDYDFGIWYKNGFRSQKYPPQKISLTSEDIYFDDSYGEVYGFTAEESGQRARFTYNYQFTDARYLTRLFFHEHFPITKKSVSFRVPSWLQLDLQEMNFAGASIKKEVKKEKDATVYTYTATGLKGIGSEPADLARPYYLPHIVVTVRSFTTGGKQHIGLKSINDMYAWYNRLYKRAVNDPAAIRQAVSTITSGARTEEDKLKAIYYWVQDNIRYIAFEDGYAGFVPQTVQEVYRNKYGDCKGMGNLITEMLKIAGLDAHFAWVGTRDIPYDRTEVQSLCVDNHAISVVYLKGKTYFVDGTEKYIPLGQNAYRIQGKNVLVQHGETFKTEVVPMAKVEENRIDTRAKLALKGESLAGTVSIRFEGEARTLFHNIYNSLPADKRKDFVQSLLQLGNRNAVVTGITQSDLKNRDLPIQLDGKVTLNNGITTVDKLQYLSIDFTPQALASLMPDDKRENPISLDQVYLSSDEVELQLPSGAKAKTLPQPLEAQFKDSRVKAVYAANGSSVVLKKETRSGTPVVLPADFAAYRTFVQGIRDYNRNNIIIALP